MYSFPRSFYFLEIPILEEAYEIGCDWKEFSLLSIISLISVTPFTLFSK